MAKKEVSEIKRLRRPGDPVIVNSKAYGKHERSPRYTYTPKTVSPALRKFAELNTQANRIAKAINDAFKPFKEEIKDGTMWSRLVGIIKKNLSANPVPDLQFLTEFEFNEKLHFSRTYKASMSFTIKDANLKVAIRSASADSINKFKASHYEQTLVVVFMNRDFITVTNTHRSLFPVDRREEPKKRGRAQTYNYDYHNDTAQFGVPANTTIILIGVKCKPLKDGVCKTPSGSGFTVLGVLETVVE